MTDDLQTIASDLKFSLEQVEKTVQLLDEGNTIPFLTRFRKDETGGLRASQILAIQQAVSKHRAIQERRAFIVKSIDSQSKLTDELRAKLDAAKSSRDLEDLYRPYKPKQQSLAMTARQQGLESLANEIFEGGRPEVDLATRATEFVRVDKNLNSVDEVIAGVKHIVSERMSERADLREQLRKIVWSTGHLVTTTIPVKEDETASAEPVASTESASESASTNTPPASEPAQPEATASQTVSMPAAEKPAEQPAAETTPIAPVAEGSSPAEPSSAEEAQPAATPTNSAEPESAAGNSTDSAGAVAPAADGDSSAPRKKKKKKKKKKKPEHPFKEYADINQAINKIPKHRILGMNRGERAGLLKVKIEADTEQMIGVITSTLPADHPFHPFMVECANDAFNRLIMPSLDREVRRELSESAEQHATSVFALNLRNLLLQPPIRNKRILAIDPGFKRGCTLVVVDESGKKIESERMAVVGNQQKKDDGRQKIIDMVTTHKCDVIAIGNGTACRQTEEIVSQALANELAGTDVKYVIVNEAGASCYSTSDIGTQEFPDETPLVRSAISIGRRLLNPLSELVKIAPANIGVGLYQHDIKAKHLSESLEEVVRDCVNLVGVDVNTACPALLCKVAGLNQLTARRIVEYREEHGAFKNREQLKQVSGIGDTTFVQAAGFLRVYGGDNRLDETSIHPESYELATKILQKVDATVDQLPAKKIVTTVAETKAESAPAVETTADAESKTVEGAQPETTEPDTPTADAGVDASAAVSTPATEQPAEPPTAQPAPAGNNSNANKELRAAISKLDVKELATEFSVGRLLMSDMVKALRHPTHDPRQNLGAPIFRSGIIKVDDLKPEMKLMAQVVNVVDFGVFVDIGLGVSCLVHISQLTNRFLRDLHQHYCVGDRMTVWVKSIDKEKKRVQLTAVAPGAKPRGKGRRRPEKRQDSEQTSSNRSGGRSGQGGSDQRGNRGRGSKAQAGRSKNYRKDRRPAKPRKPAPPITDEMLKGDKPMRSFSDLAQFIDKSKDKKK